MLRGSGYSRLAYVTEKLPVFASIRLTAFTGRKEDKDETDRYKQPIK
ncbi:hypothetical protein J25TS5_37650 [Paenibacillus faecis]|nr:hypothetical protein [Paenibacillus faecis]GIO86833.1 hypothetical protein J25TS5_37650 [Paenibacillus faecis]